MHDRIKMIRDMTKEGMITADIGTDHALLPVMLIEAHRVPHVYACDVAEGPLQRAEETIHRYHMEAEITPVLSNGFEKVPLDAQTAIIAGMGYDTAIMIMENAGDHLSDFKQIVLELHCDPDMIRTWINAKKYRIDDERFLIEKNHGYTCISMVPEKGNELKKEDIVIGPVLKHQKNPVYIDWLREQEKKINFILKKSDGKAPDAERLLQKAEIIKRYLNQ